jgi:hypothetical protein
MKGDIQINDILFTANGYTKLTEGFVSFEIKNRTINNTLVSDFLNIKKTFEISWENCSLSGDLLDQFIALYISDSDITFIKTNYDLTESTYICRLSMSESFLRDYEKDNYSYNGVKIKLEEV